jgi:predicted lipoprotein with Yx(FWY)xxD motif
MQARCLVTLQVLFTVSALAGCTLADEYSPATPAEADFVAADFEGYKQSTLAGEVMTTPEGMTVYTYAKEAKGSPSCYGACAEDWPPVLAPADAKPFGDLSLLKRIDGKRQWAYHGQPLYLYHEDKAPGDAKGDKKDDSWHVVTL